ARGPEPYTVAAGILIARLHEISLVPIMVGAAAFGRLDATGMVAGRDVDQSIRAEHRSMRSVLVHLPFELENQLDRVGLAVLIFVRQAIHARSIGPVADGEDTAVESEDSLAILQLIAVRGDGFRDSVPIGIGNDQKRPPFARGQDFAEL